MGAHGEEGAVSVGALQPKGSYFFGALLSHSIIKAFLAAPGPHFAEKYPALPLNLHLSILSSEANCSTSAFICSLPGTLVKLSR